MDESIEQRIWEVDKQIIGCYNLAKIDRNKSFLEIKRKIEFLHSQALSPHPKTYKLQCRA